MKNGLVELHNHLFKHIERLNDDDLIYAKPVRVKRCIGAKHK